MKDVPPEIAAMILATESEHVKQYQRQSTLNKRHKDIRKKKNKLRRHCKRMNRR